MNESNITKKNEKPKVLIVGPKPYPPGGIATVVSELLNSDLKREFELILFNTSTDRPHDLKGRINFGNILHSIWYCFGLVRNLILHKPQIVQIETAVGTRGASFLKNSLFSLISKVLGNKVILCVHGASFIDFYYSIGWIFKRYIKFISSMIDAVRVLPKSWVPFFQNEIKIGGEKIFNIPNSLELKEFYKLLPSDIRKTKSINLLFLGLVGKRKGIFEILQSVKQLKEKDYKFKLLIVGPGEKKGEMEEVDNLIRREEIGDFVEILGQKEHPEAVRYYKLADIFLMPSYNETGPPLAILEAMAAGVPVISTKGVGAIPEAIENGVNGYLIEPGDVEALTEKIEILLNDEQLRKEMGRRNKEKVKEQFSLESGIARFSEMYYTVLS